MVTIGGSGDRTTIRGLTALLIAAPLLATGSAGGGASAAAPPTATAPPAAIADVATEGQWSGVLPWVDRAVNAHVLPTGKVMYWPAWFGDAPARLWDPATGLTVDAPFAGYNIFCTGEVFLADGRMFVAGGSVDNVNPFGTKNTSIYDPFANTLDDAARDGPGSLVSDDDRARGRERAGRVGREPPRSSQPAAPGVADGGRQLPQPDERREVAAAVPVDVPGAEREGLQRRPERLDELLGHHGAGTWDPPIARSNFGDRDIGEGTYGSSAMYRDGKILIMGGSDPATATAEVIDLNAATPSWRYVAPMASPRKQHVATILPDGKVLVVGGHSGPGKDNPAYPVYPAELWDPATETWTTLASMATYRGYHSTAFVLPDGRVVSAGGEDVGANAEIFSPPYLFRGARPRIAAAPDRVSYGQTFSVSSPDAASVARVTLLRLPSITHGFDQNQRFAELAFTRGAGGLSVTAPTDPNLAPAGHYMLYLLNSAGVPSVAKIIRLDDAPSRLRRPRLRHRLHHHRHHDDHHDRRGDDDDDDDRPVPARPTGLSAVSPQGSRRVDLRWTDRSGNETGFRIERSANGTTFSQIATVGGRNDRLLEREPHRGDALLVPSPGLQRGRSLAAVERRQRQGSVATRRRS